MRLPPPGASGPSLTSALPLLQVLRLSYRFKYNYQQERGPKGKRKLTAEECDDAAPCGRVWGGARTPRNPTELFP